MIFFKFESNENLCKFEKCNKTVLRISNTVKFFKFELKASHVKISQIPRIFVDLPTSLRKIPQPKQFFIITITAFQLPQKATNNQLFAGMQTHKTQCKSSSRDLPHY